jgi:N-methylhydantoinase A
LELAAGKRLPVVAEILDVTDGLDSAALDAALGRLRSAGARSVCVAEAFAPDDGAAERAAVTQAISLGWPACGSAEMTGLYGLELRTVTAALNSSILHIALQTADHVEQGVRAVGVTAPVMVMRGDGGAIDATALRREPARTLYSGPAASVAGVLRTMRLDDAIVVEVGGTSTNVAAIKHGRPALSYVRVASHATAVRALDVRVVGVAGGSMLRARRGRLYGVGPRSAHMAGLPYACYLAPELVVGAVAEMIAPKVGDPTEYVVLRLLDGTRAALTNTCASVALEVVQPGDHAAAGTSVASARAALDAAGRRLGLEGREVARRMLVASADTIGALVAAVARECELEEPRFIAVGGGAGGVGRFVAGRLGLRCEIPADAEVISSIGDALSLVRIERERSVIEPSLADAEAIAAEAERACVAAGAAPQSIDTRVEYDRERATLRAAAGGSPGTAVVTMPGRVALTPEQAATLASHHGFDQPVRVGEAWLARHPRGAVLLLDRYGDVVARGDGGYQTSDAPSPDALAALVKLCTRRGIGGDRQPAVWHVERCRILALTPQAALRAVGATRPPAGDMHAFVVTAT